MTSFFTCPQCGIKQRSSRKSRARLAPHGWCTTCVRNHGIPRSGPDEVPDYRDVLPGYKLVEFRARFGMTQEGLAQQLGTATATVSSWERGQTNIPKYIQLAMSAWLAGLPPYNG